MAETTYIRVPGSQVLHIHVPTRRKNPVECDLLACGRVCQAGWTFHRRQRKPRGKAVCKRCVGAKP